MCCELDFSAWRTGNRANGGGGSPSSGRSRKVCHTPHPPRPPPPLVPLDPHIYFYLVSVCHCFYFSDFVKIVLFFYGFRILVGILLLYSYVFLAILGYMESLSEYYLDENEVNQEFPLYDMERIPEDLDVSGLVSDRFSQVLREHNLRRSYNGYWLSMSRTGMSVTRRTMLCYDRYVRILRGLSKLPKSAVKKAVSESKVTGNGRGKSKSKGKGIGVSRSNVAARLEDLTGRDSTLPALPIVSPSVFGSEKYGEAEIIRWVASNLYLKDVQPSDCPGAIAWNMLTFLRDNPSSIADFWKSTYVKLLPSRSQVEEVKRTSFDGADLVDVVNELVRMADED